MAIRIHHTQVKQAAKLGITLAKSDMDVTASRDGQQASAPSAGLAIAALLKKLGTTTADVMKTLAPKAARSAGKKAPKTKPAKSKGKTARSAGKFRCEEDGCRSTKRESDGDGGFVCSGCGADASMDGDDEGASVVKRKYKNAYRPHKMTCGDALSQQIRKEFMTVKDPDTKKLKIDWKRFTAFAQANGCWSEDYRKLNKGMRRMNVVNRLRARIARKEEVKWAV